MDQGMAEVVSPIDDTPAASAGLQPEDYLIAVDDVSIIGMQLYIGAASQARAQARA